jgi:dihydropteroate synthase
VVGTANWGPEPRVRLFPPRYADPVVRVMGVLNVTPDSFSDGGLWLDPDAAVAHGHRMIAEGADVIDVGGESTRPGARAVDPGEEMRRVLPVIEALAGGAVVSVDTRKAEVARAAVAAGATLINDVSATLWPVAADTGAGWIAMHMPAEPAVMQQYAHYDDVVTEVRDYLVARAETAATSGVREIWIDPGIGFAKTGEHNLSLLRHLDALVATGWPVLVGTSRKSFLGRIGGHELAPDDRLEATVATSTWAMAQGVQMVRVHDVGPAVMAARLAGQVGSSAMVREGSA